MTDPPDDISFDILGERLNENEPEGPGNPAVLRVDVTDPSGETFSSATCLPENTPPNVLEVFTARLRAALGARPAGSSPRRVVEQCGWWTPDDLRA